MWKGREDFEFSKIEVIDLEQIPGNLRVLHSNRAAMGDQTSCTFPQFQWELKILCLFGRKRINSASSLSCLENMINVFSWREQSNTICSCPKSTSFQSPLISCSLRATMDEYLIFRKKTFPLLCHSMKSRSVQKISVLCNTTGLQCYFPRSAGFSSSIPWDSGISC